MTEASTKGKVSREARLRWVPIPKMRTSALAQRELNPARVDKIKANLDLEQIGNPTVNLRTDGNFYIIDGQHRVAALRDYGFGDDSLQCWAYEGLTEEEEAETFLKLNDILTVSVFDKYKRGVVAGREVETDIERILAELGLGVTRDKVPGAIQAVGTLQRVYNRAGVDTFTRTLVMARDAYGDAGLEARVIDGLGHFIGRYNGQLDDEQATKRLSGIRGGVNGLLGRAEVIHQKTRQPKGHCVAAAAVDIYNTGIKRSGGGKRLPSWWKGDDK